MAILLRGKTLRSLIKRGEAPEPGVVLEPLSQIWSIPTPPEAPPLDLRTQFRSARLCLEQLLRREPGRRLLEEAVDALGPFVESWRPSSMAHNDFYDDQVLIPPGERPALVDFEELGLGDPLMDVGNMLSHLHGLSRFGSATEAFSDYHRRTRSAALRRFGWEERDLDLREALALFNLSNFPIRRIRERWEEDVTGYLRLAADVLRRSRPAAAIT